MVVIDVGNNLIDIVQEASKLVEPDHLKQVEESHNSR